MLLLESPERRRSRMLQEAFREFREAFLNGYFGYFYFTEYVGEVRNTEGQKRNNLVVQRLQFGDYSCPSCGKELRHSGVVDSAKPGEQTRRSLYCGNVGCSLFGAWQEGESWAEKWEREAS